uniref:DEAD-box ATP-dependent RNA helicase 36 n=1 Tax=Rhizophora mucronata TaxID=61149 RepID=A0A2P2KI42_RHIMU
MEEKEEETLADRNFPLFSKPSKTPKPLQQAPQKTHHTHNAQNPKTPKIEQEKSTNTDPNSSTDPAAAANSSFSHLGLAEWATQTCKELGMKKPTPVQAHCIPKILAGRDVLGLAQTGSGKTAAFALPILHRLAGDPYGVFALVLTPTRELAYQLAEHFRALGSSLHLRCAVVVGGMDMLTQAQALMGRPHVVIATPGRIKVLLEENPDIPPVLSRTKNLSSFKLIIGRAQSGSCSTAFIQIPVFKTSCIASIQIWTSFYINCN